MVAPTLCAVLMAGSGSRHGGSLAGQRWAADATSKGPQTFASILHLRFVSLPPRCLFCSPCLMHFWSLCCWQGRCARLSLMDPSKFLVRLSNDWWIAYVGHWRTIYVISVSVCVTSVKLFPGLIRFHVILGWTLLVSVWGIQWLPVMLFSVLNNVILGWTLFSGLIRFHVFWNLKPWIQLKRMTSS